MTSDLRPRNVLARNWRHATLDVTVGNPWRLRPRRRTFRIFTDGPTEHVYIASLGPLRVTFWPKARMAVSGRFQRGDEGDPGPVAQSAEAPGSNPGQRGFDSRPAHQTRDDR